MLPSLTKSHISTIDLPYCFATDTTNLKFFKTNSSAAFSYTSFRDEGFPFLNPTKYGATAITAADNTTKTVTVNSDKNVILITGTVTLTTGDYLVNLSTTGAVAGDMVVIKYGAHVTVGSYKVSINGHDLSAVEALGVNLIIEMCNQI